MKNKKLDLKNVYARQDACFACTVCVVTIEILLAAFFLAEE